MVPTRCVSDLSDHMSDRLSDLRPIFLLGLSDLSDVDGVPNCPSESLHVVSPFKLGSEISTSTFLNRSLRSLRSLNTNKHKAILMSDLRVTERPSRGAQ